VNQANSAEALSNSYTWHWDSPDSRVWRAGRTAARRRGRGVGELRSSQTAGVGWSLRVTVGNQL